jgi:hypothetical protein
MGAAHTLPIGSGRRSSLLEIVNLASLMVSLLVSAIFLPSHVTLGNDYCRRIEFVPILLSKGGRPAMDVDCSRQEASQNVPDRRRHPRYRYSAPITALASDGSVVPGITLEISESGLSAVFGVPLQVGDKTEVEPVAGGKASARIRRNLGKVYGFEFLDLTTEQALQLRDKCKKLPIYRCQALGI